MPPLEVITEQEIATGAPVVGVDGFAGKTKRNFDALSAALGEVGVSQIANGSFEVVDNDLIPVAWQFYDYPNGSHSSSGTSAHGARSMSFTHPGGAGNGGGYGESDYLACFYGSYDFNALVWADSPVVHAKVVLRFFDAAQVDLLADLVIWDSSGGVPTDPYNLSPEIDTPAGSRFLKVIIYGGIDDLDSIVETNVYFDDIRLTPKVPINLNTVYRDNTEDIYRSIVDVDSGAGSWISRGSQVLTLDMIDGGGGDEVWLACTAGVYTSISSNTTSVRIKIGSVYSNVFESAAPSAWRYGQLLIKLKGITSPEVTVEFQSKISYGGVGTAEIRITSNDTVLALVEGG